MEHILNYLLEHFIFSPFLEHYPERISKRILKKRCETQFSSEHISPRFLEHILERFSKHFGGTLKKHIVKRFADHIRNGTGCYKVVTLPSTDLVRCCLTLMIVQERVFNLVRMLVV